MAANDDPGPASQPGRGALDVDGLTVGDAEEAAVRRTPQLADSVWVAPTAFVSGGVTLEDDVSVWPGAAVRGDMEPIVVRAGSNIQDNAVLHTSPGTPLLIEEKVTVGHGAVVHGAKRIGAGTLVGMNAVVLDEADVGKGCLIAAGAVVAPGTVVPDHSLVAGVPGKVVKTDERLYAMNMHNHRSYLVLKELYRSGKVAIVEPGSTARREG